jgi:hypothetical protein
LKGLFGEDFAEYDSKVDDYLPRLKAYGRGKGKWRFENVIENSEEGIVALVVIGTILIALRSWI